MILSVLHKRLRGRRKVDITKEGDLTGEK